MIALLKIVNDKDSEKWNYDVIHHRNDVYMHVLEHIGFKYNLYIVLKSHTTVADVYSGAESW